MLREVKVGLDGGSGRPGTFYGLSHRIWLLIGIVIGIFTFSRLLLPTSDSSASDALLLTPKDYINASASDPAPFDFCPVFGPGDDVATRRGQWGLLRSRLHMGSGARVQKVVQKAMAGLPVTISVLGGSVSACHGAGDDPVSPKCYPARFFNWWNSIFPHPDSEITNGASRKTDSAYFAYCSQHHLPDQTDLVILEFDAEDPNDPEWLSHFELLVRSILVRPDQPAVIILGHFAPQLQAQNGYAGPELLHTVVAQFYDIPHISAKGILYHDYLLDPQDARGKFFADPMLANPDGHELISDLLISYMQTQICSGWAATMGHAFDVPYMGAPPPSSGIDPVLAGNSAVPGEADESEGGGAAAKQRAVKVPSAMLTSRPSDILKFREVAPYCVSANDLLNPLPPSHFYGSGWHAYHPSKGAAQEEKHYWYAEVGGSSFRVHVTLSAGDVAIYYLHRNPEETPLGRAACWVDDNVAGAVELSGISDVHGTTTTLTLIDENVAPGEHYVECTLIGKEGQKTPPFKMLGV
ncbi:capsular associated protein [Cryptococcus wingfieldii CBS 7118]|uniref:Capsular associated protein n=1 Tax=Cryptococcus wingfieldii CBS 7118 TaxID=1295528 RepID=A0A1E3K357_9TREE|nr:capsular associated protein [Cryptococcus wingfieldii CBS 7118]ODO07461.1 capsular associated protein [Cryptococcus wingfieldii CBS 7118]